MSSCVLDASALIALFHQEPGSDKVAQAIEDGAVISTLNLSEVASELAYKVGFLRPLTKSAGLSLGGRACLALAQHLNLPALTTDRVWKDLIPEINVQVIR
jgi:ribonuclease VapC